MKEIILTDKAPGAVGPYSQAVKKGNLLFCSGQIPLDPETGDLVQGGIKAQTKRAMENLKAVIESAGYGLEDIVKATIYITDMDKFAEVNEVYASFFSSDFPARVTVGVAALPKGAMVEIDAIACG
ncbi:MAG: RidA family protein [Spirochaetes bacterium]|nr:RidA family protein [Spirochaetota bacterium]